MRGAALLLLAAASGCAPRPDAAEATTPIARVHATVCGSCHTRVEPGARTRADLEAALARHHRRVHLSEAEWQAMVDYMAKPATQANAVDTR